MQHHESADTTIVDVIESMGATTPDKWTVEIHYYSGAILWLRDCSAQGAVEVRLAARKFSTVERIIVLPQIEAPRQTGGWVSRALANDLPVFSTHQGAFAYLPVKE